MFDCTLINDELDLLEIRLETLDPIIEKFIIVESDKTHSGIPKPLHFNLNKSKFAKFENKIIHLVFNAIDVEKDNQSQSWFNEGSQRNKFLEIINDVKPCDNFCFVSDVDEIPRLDKLLEARDLSLQTDMPVAFEINWSLYWLNYAYPVAKQFRGPYLYNPYRAEIVHKRFGQVRYDPSYFRWHMCSPGYENDFPKISDSGWHFSWMGGISKIKTKLESYAHLDWNRENIKSEDYIAKCMVKGKDIYGHVEETLERKDKTWLPLYVQNNLDKFQHLIL